MMSTITKAMLVAMGVAVLASPVMARPERHSHAAPAAAITERSAVQIKDCVRVQFPQCGDSVPSEFDR